MQKVAVVKKELSLFDVNSSAKSTAYNLKCLATCEEVSERTETKENSCDIEEKTLVIKPLIRSTVPKFIPRPNNSLESLSFTKVSNSTNELIKQLKDEFDLTIEMSNESDLPVSVSDGNNLYRCTISRYDVADEFEKDEES